MVRTTVVVHKISSSPLRSSAIMKGKITNSLKQLLMQRWSAFNMFLVLRVCSLRKSEFYFFLLHFLSKFMDIYGYRLVLDSVNFGYAEMCWRYQQMFATRYFRKMSKDNRKRFKIHSSTRIVMCTNFFIISYILQSYPIKGLYRLPRCIAPCKEPPN